MPALRPLRTYVLDSENVRQFLCKDLGFASEGWTENILRVGKTAMIL